MSKKKFLKNRASGRSVMDVSSAATSDQNIGVMHLGMSPTKQSQDTHGQRRNVQVEKQM